MTDLRAQLGAKAVPCPTMDIGNSFTTIVNKALGIAGFFPYNTDTNFLIGERRPAALGNLLHCETVAIMAYDSCMASLWG